MYYLIVLHPLKLWHPKIRTHHHHQEQRAQENHWRGLCIWFFPSSPARFIFISRCICINADTLNIDVFL